MDKTVFDLSNRKIVCYSFSSFSALKKSKNTFPPVQNVKKCWANFRITLKFSEALLQVKRLH